MFSQLKIVFLFFNYFVFYMLSIFTRSCMSEGNTIPKYLHCFNKVMMISLSLLLYLLWFDMNLL